MAIAELDAPEDDLVGVHVADKMCSDTYHTESENISTSISAHLYHVHHWNWPECLHDCLDDFSDW